MTNPAPGQLTRQELYDKIRETSKDEYILAEMKRLGFWEQNENKPDVPGGVIARRGELQRQLNELLKQQRLYADPEEALKALRKERMQAALEKRAETRKKKADDRHQAALSWHEKQQHTISWLGEAVSLGLSTAPAGLNTPSKDSGAAKISKQGAVETNEVSLMKHQDLPTFESHKALAESIGISLNELRFLAYQRSTSKVSHYQHFQIAKKTGGYREISAPMPRLKRAQYWVLDNILCHVPLHDAAHGFVAGRSILSNAKPHVGQAVVVNLDLQNFFPTISYRRIKGLFHKMGYSESIATVLALLCSEADTQKMELDGEQWFVQQGEQHLPQGAPTSPTISNIICRSLDIRLQGLAKKHGFAYTRYADDMTFSGDKTAKSALRKLLWGVQAIVREEGFTLHPDKTRIMNQGQQQEVTGIVVNDYPSIDRKTLRRFRALLHQVEQSGIQGKSWNGVSEPEHLMRSILGFANFVAMVLPEKGESFKQQAKAIYQQHSSKSGTKTIGQLRKAEFRKRAAAGQKPWDNWQEASVNPPPEREKTPDELKEERRQVLAERRQERKAIEAQANQGSLRRRGNTGFTDYDDDDDFEYEQIRLPELGSLGRFNRELRDSKKHLQGLPFAQMIRILIFDRKQLQRIGMAGMKADILIDDVDFDGQEITDKAQTLREIDRFKNTMEQVYRSHQSQHLKRGLLSFGASILLNALFSWKVLPTILLISSVFKGANFFKARGNLKQLQQWHRAAVSYTRHAARSEEEGVTVSDEYSSSNALQDSARIQQHQLDKEKKDWAVRLFDFISRLFKGKK